MAKLISPTVPSVGTLTAVADPAVRRALQPLLGTHNVQTGATQDRLVSQAELEVLPNDAGLTVTGAPVTATKTATGKFLQVSVGNEVYYLALFSD